jgi:hypothetical protein
MFIGIKIEGVMHNKCSEHTTLKVFLELLEVEFH